MRTPLQIDFANEQSLLAVDESRLAEVAQQILIDAGVRAGSLSIAIVDDAVIHRLNNQFLKHDYATDVLSFALDEDRDAFEGEVVVSVETAIRSAGDYDLSPESELALYVIHGTLHLAGYRDTTEAERMAIRAAESRYLRMFGIPPASSPAALEGA
jgi:probable rRNA maturation factor